MNVSLFGLGYVGVVSAACLAEDGHTVVGIDPLASKVDLVNQGISPVVEKDIGELVARHAATGRLRASHDVRSAVHGSELSLVCVGTPSQGNGSLDLSHVKTVCEEIGQALASKAAFHGVVIRSTLLPGTLREMVIPTLEAASGKRAGEQFGVCIHPEFLREGSAVWDYRHPPFTLIGETDGRSGALLSQLYTGLEAPELHTRADEAEMVKYVCNAWHAVKVGFANEVGNVCKALGLDSHRVMDTFCLDTKLNLSAAYLKPGFAFGGSCLPKDLRALNYRARSLDLDLPLLASLLPSNERQIERGFRMITRSGSKRVGFLGLSFKPGTDDLRESPIVEVIEKLIGKGYELKLYDRHVHLAALTGANRDYILHRIPHISRLLVGQLDEVLAHADVLVLGHAAPEFDDIASRMRPGQKLVDWVRLRGRRPEDGAYEGIGW
jgi:GDP-mannose 6-dehydrogenase